MRMRCVSVLLMLAVMGSARGETTVDVSPEVVICEVDLPRLLGTNAGLWYTPRQLEALRTGERLRVWRPGLIRIPGGSWGDELVWNGHGVRQGNSIDVSKYVDGRWQVDFSGYAPGFRADARGRLSDFHGHVDVKAMHEFIRDLGGSAIVTVNAGTGTPEMAAEWVRWAKANAYPVAYWEIGNELEGEWEQGHRRPDGREMTGEIYAEIYLAFAKAMKAVDPSIKVGGPAASNDGVVLAPALLKKAAEWVDFISYHTYPANSHEGPAKLFAEADSVRHGMQKVRELIREHAPARADEIEIGITEWHVGIHEGARTVNEISGPWCAKWIGRMAESGVDFANVWDLFSATAQGGHGVLGKDESLTPRGPYWALALWQQEMGGRLLRCETRRAEGVVAFATATEGGMALLLINESEESPAPVRVQISGSPVVGTLEAHELSTSSYLWNSRTNAPVWSRPPVMRSHTLDRMGGLILPALSATVLHLNRAAPPMASGRTARLGIFAPERLAADLPGDAWITLLDASGNPVFGGEHGVMIETTGPIEVDRAMQTLHRAATRVRVRPTGVGRGEIIVRGAGLEARHGIELKRVSWRTEVLWNFAQADSVKKLQSPHTLSHREGALHVALTPVEGNRLVVFNELPACDKSKIGGFTVKLRAEGLEAPAEGKIGVVLQSKARQWMPLGEIPLADLTDGWSTRELKVPDPDYLDAMPDVYAVILLLQGAGDAGGALAIDDAGFLMRD